MSNAMLSGVSGLKAHQSMIDVAGNNLSNINTVAFKSSRVTFQELLSETLKEASSPTANLGGTNPMQIGNGVIVGSVDRNMGQGSLQYTGNPMDMALEGSGYFTLNTGLGDIYTRVGQFAVDSQYYMVDPTTGYRVQRIGNEGVAEGFQDPTSNDIRIPYDIALPARTTETIGFAGNLSGNQMAPTINLLTSGLKYTTGSGTVASRATYLTDLDQLTGGLLATGDTITLTGTTRDGTVVAPGVYTYNALSHGGLGDTMGDMLDAITAMYQVGGVDASVAKIINGEIRLEDLNAGYSQAYIASMTFTDATAGGVDIEMPIQFDILVAGGEIEKSVNVEIYDTQGNSYTLAGSFIRRDDYANTWDFVIKTVGGNTTVHDRKITGITFQTDGSFGDMHAVVGDANGMNIELEFVDSDPGNIRSIRLDLGTLGELDGLTQFGGPSTAASNGQDGYSAGWLSTMSVSREGILVGVFTNGIRRDLAALKIATYQNSAGLKSVGGNYFEPTANSGDPVANKATEGGAGVIHGGAVEKSNVEVAEEFVKLIEAQNGYQANARTIKVANEMLRELTQLIR
ncbi:MAG: flagellar hook-basal body complex protein [Phycisphaerae bacterium]|nr:flagellar hook-basal body complex protein [Phycisphaerae bacterium]